jgi:hypothetical protein
MADLHTHLCGGAIFIGQNPEKFTEVGGAKQSPTPQYITFNVIYF